ncbi:MAG: YibE/F family protein [Clostridiales bacterium]|nr:YibE/F family protein [Clostridiales bacterium]
MVNRKEKSLYRLLPYGIVLVVILLLVIMPQENADFQSLVSSGISYQRGTVIQVLSQSLEESPLGSGMLGSQDLAVRLQDGSEVQMTNYLTDTHNILAEEGSKVIICVDAPDGVEPYYTVYNYDRTSALVLIFAVFILLMLLVGGKQGANAVLALAVSLLLIVRFTVPAIYRGSSPIAVGALTAFAATAVTLLLLHGATVRALLAAGVTLAGEGTACILFAVSSALLHVGGFQTDQAEGLLVVAQNTGLHLKTLLFAATMIASLGAVMDVAVSLLSALWELKQQGTQDGGQLFRSGMNIGKDMIGTMSNTLIFAFAGNALATMLSLTAYGVQASQLLNSNYIALEIAQGLCGTGGVILTVPIASAAAAALFPRLKAPDRKPVHI